MTVEEYRAKAIEEYGDVCQRCFGERGSYKLIVHHINEDRSDNRIENLAPLCGSCHQIWHKNDNLSDFEAFADSFPDEKIDRRFKYKCGRALITDDEKEILRGDRDVTEDHYHHVVERVRQRIEKLIDEDLPALEEHDILAGELRDGVCED